MARFFLQDSFLLITQGQPFTLSASKATRWTGVVVPSGHLPLASDFISSLASLLFYQKTISAAPATVHCLNSIKHLASGLSGAAEYVAIGAATLRRAEEKLLAAASNVLLASIGPTLRRVGRPSLSRGIAIAKVLDVVDARIGTPLCIHGLCGATGVAERTLRNIFREYFGMAPMRLLRLHQLSGIRTALLAAPPRETVNRIATGFGIRDLSLFGRNYKALFGESPSQTLRMAAARAQRDVTARESWLHYTRRAVLEMADERPRVSNSNCRSRMRRASALGSR